MGTGSEIGPIRTKTHGDPKSDKKKVPCFCRVMNQLLRQTVTLLLAGWLWIGAVPSVQALQHSFVADAVRRVAPAVVRIDT